MADGKERLIKRSGWPYHDIKHFRGGQERWLVPIIKVYIRAGRGLNASICRSTGKYGTWHDFLWKFAIWKSRRY